MLLLLCARSFSENPQSSPLPSNSPGKFVDRTAHLGIHFQHEASLTTRKYLLESMGSGVALFDYDNDGRLDIFFANGARIEDPMAKGAIPRKDNPKYWSRLYHQKPDGTFEGNPVSNQLVTPRVISTVSCN